VIGASSTSLATSATSLFDATVGTVESPRIRCSAELPISAGMQLSSSAHIERSELREACPQPTAAGTSQDACALRGQQVGASHRLGSVEWVAGQDLEADLHAGGPFGQ
jgi:hypothetical protein